MFAFVRLVGWLICCILLPCVLWVLTGLLLTGDLAVQFGFSLFLLDILVLNFVDLP